MQTLLFSDMSFLSLSPIERFIYSAQFQLVFFIFTLLYILLLIYLIRIKNYRSGKKYLLVILLGLTFFIVAQNASIESLEGDYSFVALMFFLLYMGSIIVAPYILYRSSIFDKLKVKYIMLVLVGSIIYYLMFFGIFIKILA